MRPIPVLLILTIAGTAACGADGDTRPFSVVGPTPASTAPPPSPAGPTGRLTVTNGWTNAPVAQALVTIGAETVVADAAGQFEVTAAGPCVGARIVAPGYLDRRVNCLPPAASQGRMAVTLWPVENDAERAALREFAFRGFPGIQVQPYAVSLEIASDVANRKAVVEAWQAAGRTIATMTGGAANLRIEPLDEDGAVLKPWSTPADCSPDFRWTPSLAGFCGGNRVGYFAHVLLVAPEFMADERVALRALLYEQGLRPHALPGLLNATRPADTLSDFEMRTLHMIGLRRRPYPGGVNWPDLEF